MRNFPQELVVALVFGAVWLVQFLYKLLRRHAASMRARTNTGPAPLEMPTPSAAPPTPEPAAAAEARPAARTRQAVPTVRVSRRYSKAALMPDHRAVQDAIVIAAILQPCHAQRPAERE